MKNNVLDWKQEKLLRSALNALAAEEIYDAMQDESLDVEYERTLHGVNRYIERIARRRRGNSFVKIFVERAMVVGLIILLSIGGVSCAMPYIIENWFSDIMIGEVSRKELYEARCVVDFTLDENGELRSYQFVMDTPFGTQNDAYGNSTIPKAASWIGTIEYMKYMVADEDSAEIKEVYIPVSFWQSVEVYDYNIILHDLYIDGGASGIAYNVLENGKRQTAVLDLTEWIVKDVKTEAMYRDTFRNPGYAFARNTKEDVAAVDVSGWFTYHLKTDADNVERRTEESKVRLLDWIK